MRITLAITLALTFGLPIVASATSYNGYSNTGFRHYGKRQCCESAVVEAQEDSARACKRAGGFADYKRNTSRGKCKWDRRRDKQGRWVYSCSGVATVLCR